MRLVINATARETSLCKADVDAHLRQPRRQGIGSGKVGPTGILVSERGSGRQAEQAGQLGLEVQ